MEFPRCCRYATGLFLHDRKGLPSPSRDAFRLGATKAPKRPIKKRLSPWLSLTCYDAIPKDCDTRVREVERAKGESMHPDVEARWDGNTGRAEAGT